MGKSIRFRLTIWYAVVITASLTIFAAALWVSMWRMLERDITHAFSNHVGSIGSFIKEELADPSVRLPEELAEFSHALPDNTFLQVLAKDGTSVFTSRVDFPWRSVDLTTGKRTHLDWRGQPYSVLAQPVTVASERWQVVFAISLAENQALLRRLLALLLTLGPAAVFIACLGGWWLSGRALKPVDEITAAARQIGVQNLSGRLAVSQTGDELQRLSETWNSMLDRLEQAVSRLSRFTADASHELRTPLAVIRSTAEIASRRSRPAEDYRRALEEVVAESERMSVLIDDLLFLARCDSESLDLPMEKLELTGIVEEVRCLLDPIASEMGLCLRAKASAELPAVIGNRSAVRRLLLVLLDNAFKYSRSGGIVTIVLSSMLGEVHMKVCDEGVGIPESELPLLFQRFFRGFSARESGTPGSGLGLALARGIAQHHGSVINVESAMGKGSVFDVVFPAAT